MSSSEFAQIGLPELQQAVLDEGMIRTLVRDISTLTNVIAIIPKMGARSMVSETELPPDDLEGSIQELFEGSFRGLQVRYEFEGLQWWDSLLAIPETRSFRLIRISHDLSTLG